MPGTISMQTEQALQVAAQLEQNARLLEQLTGELNTNFRQLEGSWQGGGARDVFFAETSDLRRRAEILNRELADLYSRLVREVKEWEMADSRFGKGASAGAVGSVAAGIAGAVGAAVRAGTGGGEVLGAAISAAGVDSKNYREMSWSDKFAEEAALANRIAEAEDELANMLTPEERAKAAKDLDKDIAYWQAKKAELEKILKNPLNHLPGNLKGDKAVDIYNEEIKRCEEQIATLENRKSHYLDEEYWSNHKLQLENNITQLKSQQAELNQAINQGIPTDGPTKGIDFAGCARWVAQKRDVSDFFVYRDNPEWYEGVNNAGNWDDNARNAGFDVGIRPVPGSIMVLEENNSLMSGVGDAGHAVYIENVTPVEGGYKITYSEASTPRIPGTDKWDGTYRYVDQRTTTKTIKPPLTGVSFIYEQN